MSKCPDCNKCKDDHCPCARKCECNKDHHHYHHDYHGHGRSHPMRMSASMEIVPMSDMVSTRDWSKDPARNTEIGGVYIGCNMSGSDYPLALQALAAGVASLTADVGAGATWAQFETVYALRKYEGDADCIFTLKPKPKAWVLSDVTPPPPEGPAVQRDCLARTWVTCESKFDTCEVTEANGQTTYTFKQTLGDGTVVDGGDFVVTIPTIIGLPDLPVKSGANDKTEYMLCQSPCVNDGEPEWKEKLRPVTDAEFTAGTADGGTWPDNVYLTPQQVCDKIAAADGGGGGDGGTGGGGGSEPPAEVCPPASDFTISADRTTATYNGTETNVQMCYRDNFGNSGVAGSASRGICFPITPGQTVSLSHDNYDPFVLGSMEVVTGGVSYAGTPPDVPGARPVRASETPPGFSFFVSDGTCPSITLLSTQSDGGSGTIEARSTGVFSYA